MSIMNVTARYIDAYSESNQRFLIELLESEWIPPHCHNRDGRCYYYKGPDNLEDQPETMLDYELYCQVICDCEVICNYEYEYYQTGADESGSNLNVLRELKLVFPDSSRKQPVVTEVSPDELSSTGKLKTFLLAKGASGFKGSYKAHHAFLDFITMQQRPKRIRIYKYWGEIMSGIFLYKDGVFNTHYGEIHKASNNGETYFQHDNKSYTVKGITDQIDMNPPHLFQDTINANLSIDEVRMRFHDFVDQWSKVNGQLRVGIYLGFITASLFKEKIIQESPIRGFPMLFNYGRYGLGKSDIMHMLQAFYGLDKSNAISLKGSTPKGVIRSLSKMCTFPILLDDYRNDSSDKDSFFDQKMLNWYHNIGDKSGVKTTDNSTFTTPMKATLLITGNEKPMDPAVLSRLILLSFSSTDKSSQKRADIDKLQELSTVSPYIFKRMFRITAYEDAYGFFMGRYDYWVNELDEEISEKRYTQNYALTLAGLDQLNEAYGLSLKSEDLFEDIVEHINTRLNEQIQFDPVNLFLSGIDQYVSREKSDGHRIDDRHLRVISESDIKSSGGFKASFGRALAIHFNSVWEIFKLCNHDIIKLGKPKVKSALESSDLLLKKSHQTTLAVSRSGNGSRNVRCLCLNLEELLKNGEYVTLKQYVNTDKHELLKSVS